MSLTEVLTNVRSLSPADKLQLIRILAKDLAATDALLAAGATIPNWSPHDSFEAARTLMKALESESGPSQ
jgi:hypothetical protein